MPPLSRQLFVLLSSFVEERAGLHYDPDDNPLFSDKVGTRIIEAGFENPLDYYYFLRYDPAGGAELAALLDVLVVGETYLFRERDALLAAVDHVLRPAVEARGRARAWIAGCSTGDEPFTLAMMLADAGLLANVEIVATDLSHRALKRAQSGTVSARSLRSFDRDATSAPPPWATRMLGKWIERSANGSGQVAPEIVSAISFRRDNLLSPTVASPPDNDLVTCRNVLIYFQDDVVRRTVSMLSGRLRKGGRLLVGASESLLRFGTLLRCEERAGTFFYVKGTE